MRITKERWFAAGLGLAVIAAVSLLWYAGIETSAPTESLPPIADSLPVATSSAPATIAAPKKPPSLGEAFAVDSADSILSWDFKSAYTGNAALSEKARVEIARLTGLLGEGTYSDYTLYVSIANQYDLLGDGKNEFAYLKKALALDARETGLAWHNAGQLLARLGALVSARTAFERAVAAQPTLQYHRALLDFLKERYPEDARAIAAEEQAIAEAQSDSAQ